MNKSIIAFAIVLVLIGLARVGAAPPQVPIDAWPRFSIKNGVVWYWDREVPEGCVSWLAMERWASIRVMVDTECSEWGSEENRNAEGLFYSSTTDESTFYGYWPWPQGTSFDYYVYDNEGNWIETQPCPHSLSARQIGSLSTIVGSAKAVSRTAQEKAMLDRLGYGH